MKKITLLTILTLNLLVVFLFPNTSLAKTGGEDYLLFEEATRIVDSVHQFKITLSEEIPNEFLTESFIFIEDSEGNVEDIRLTFGEGPNVIAIAPPKNGYKPNEMYTIYISANIKSISGKPINHGTKLHFFVREVSGDPGEEDSQEKPRLLTSTKGKEEFTLHKKDDVDYFQLYLNAGEAISFDILHNTNVVISDFYYFDEEKNKWSTIRINNSSNRHTEDTGFVSYMAEKDGNYQIRVSPNHSAPWASTRKLIFDYEVLVGDSEEVDSANNARTLSNQSGERNFTIHALNDVDYFNFNLDEEETFKFDIEGMSLTGTGRYILYHYDVYEDDWVMKKSDWYHSRSNTISYRATEKGLYQLRFNVASTSHDNWNFKANLKLYYSKE